MITLSNVVLMGTRFRPAPSLKLHCSHLFGPHSRAVATTRHHHQLVVSAAAIMVHVVVFGATGFLGSEITKALAARGHSTAAVVRDATPSDANKTARLGEFERAGITVIQHDGSSRDGLVNLLKNFTHVVNAVGEALR